MALPNEAHPLHRLVAGQKAGQAVGICSVCSANQFVLEAAMEQALRRGGSVLVEATSNQVNQFGGYTGMTPRDFYSYAQSLAQKVGLERKNLLLGGDHLGPLVWAQRPAQEAMALARELVQGYVRAGFTKIHVDASMRLGGDPTQGRLSQSLVAERTAELMAAAEEALPPEEERDYLPVYVVGSEVPIPGGAVEDTGMTVTRSEDLAEFWQALEEALERRDLRSLLQRIIAVVVQPGAEFSELEVDLFEAPRAQELAKAIQGYPGLIFEGHSTDYQTAESLKAMVASGVGILKVGPELTFALREGVFALAQAEEILAARHGFAPSHIREVLERQMTVQSGHWISHYIGSPQEQYFLRRYSYSDRIRYYWSDPEVSQALDRLIANLEAHPIPMVLLSQVLPLQYERVRQGRLSPQPRPLLKDCIVRRLEKYEFATGICL